MRSFQQFFFLLLTLLGFAIAQEYDTTVYVTSTVYRVNTVTLSGTPTGSVQNQTSIIYPSIPSSTPSPVYSAGNGTTVQPTGTNNPSQPEFTGAASALNINAFVAVVAAGVGYLAL